jgi:hypothetical protein
MVTESFKVIRFGVLDRGMDAPVVVGLTDKKPYTLRRSDYMSKKGGSWQITGNYLIHDGADDPSWDAWGAIGCIEITGKGEWQHFESLVAELSGTPDVWLITSRGTLHLDIDAAALPPLRSE